MEIINYKSANEIKCSQCPLEWWKSNNLMYPTLNIFAKKYLISQAISVSSERVFSTANNILTDSRNSLSGDMVDKLIFIHHNT